jgi:hypothetical protein
MHPTYYIPIDAVWQKNVSFGAFINIPLGEEIVEKKPNFIEGIGVSIIKFSPLSK